MQTASMHATGRPRNPLQPSAHVQMTLKSRPQRRKPRLLLPRLRAQTTTSLSWTTAQAVLSSLTMTEIRYVFGLRKIRRLILSTKKQRLREDRDILGGAETTIEIEYAIVGILILCEERGCIGDFVGRSEATKRDLLYKILICFGSYANGPKTVPCKISEYYLAGQCTCR